ncbi:MAG: transporter substrate-binding domain-containing protein [Clostridia bacterium]|nr:transporter substrate-binding domain-containing protein [Clostridia bacterium]
MKKLITTIAAILAGVSCFSFAACNEKKTVTIGYTDYAPMNYTNDKGELVGFDTELAKKAFGDLGYEVRFKLINWDNKYMEVNSGTIDCIWNGFTANCADADGVERSDKVDFSYYYMTNAQCVIRLSSSAELTSSSEFVEKSVAYESGSAGDSYVSAVTGNINKKPVSSQMDAVREVNAGTAQYAVIDLLLAKSLVGQNDYKNIVINEGIVIDAEYYAIGFKKDSELTSKINEKLVAYAESGYLAQLAEKYDLSNQVITDYSDQITD